MDIPKPAIGEDADDIAGCGAAGDMSEDGVDIREEDSFLPSGEEIRDQSFGRESNFRWDGVGVGHRGDHHMGGVVERCR